MGKSVGIFAGVLSGLSISWFLVFFGLAAIGLWSLDHFRDSALRHREVMQTSLREAKMPEAQTRAISESLSHLETDVETLVTITFGISVVFIATAYSRAAEQPSRKPHTQAKERPDRVKDSTA